MLSNIFRSRGLYFLLISQEIVHTASTCASRGSNLPFQIRKKCRCTKKFLENANKFFYCIFVHKNKLSVHRIMKLAYYLLAGVKVVHFTIITVSDSFYFEDIVINSDGITVEIGEAKRGKNKYHSGHPDYGLWVLLGVERTPIRILFLF
ncbi:hypothetical protein HZS_6022 [Henneguya salminicola]|nr:hypothetical protein HZS_6022 [Henneguya salminicola]